MPINLVLACDDNYALPLAVCLRSVFDSADNPSDVRAYVISCGIAEASRERVRTSVGPYASQVLFIDLDTSSLSGLPPVGDHIGSLAVYGRLFMPQLLPDDVDRVLYLDVDTLVLSDLSELWNVDLGCRAIGGALDYQIPTVSSPGGVSRWQSLGIGADAPFVNSGVLLCDLKALRVDSFFERALEYLYANPSPNWYDQEAINAAAAGRVAIIDQKWNVMHLWMKTEIAPQWETEATRILADIRIRHYTSWRKPWLAGASAWVPDVGNYMRAVDRTVWKGWRPSFGPCREGDDDHEAPKIGG